MCPHASGSLQTSLQTGTRLEVPTLQSHGCCLGHPTPIVKLSGPPATSHRVNIRKQINSRILGALCQERNKDQIFTLYFTGGSVCSSSMEGGQYLLHSTIACSTHTHTHVHTYTPHACAHLHMCTHGPTCVYTPTHTTHMCTHDPPHVLTPHTCVHVPHVYTHVTHLYEHTYTT